MSVSSEKLEAAWFRSLCKSVNIELNSKISKYVWTGKRSPSALRKTNSDGWMCEFGSVRNDRGSRLEVWFDRWTGGSARRLCYCYRSPTKARVERIANAGGGHLGQAHRLDEAYARRSDGAAFNAMSTPLARSLFGKPLLETTERVGYSSFLGVYELQAPRLSAPASVALIRKMTQFLAEIAGVANELADSTKRDAEFPKIRKRSVVRMHVHYERNSTATLIAKSRTKYRCQVCDFDFVAYYGPVGKNFAEAHHVRQLSKLRSGTKIVAEDLICVCANCHRMLHRMSGAPGDWQALRKAVARRRRGAV